MSTFNSLLLILIGISILMFFTRIRKMRKDRTLNGALEDEMVMAANIARAAANDAFAIELDATDEAVAKLDQLIEAGWANTTVPLRPEERASELPEESLTKEQLSEREEERNRAEKEEGKDEEPVSIFEEDRVDDSFFVLGAYLGTLLTQLHGGVWHFDKETHKLPYVYFKSTELAISPFDLIKRKLQNPQSYDLTEAYHKVLMEIDLRKSQPRPQVQLHTPDRILPVSTEQSAVETPAVEIPVESPQEISREVGTREIDTEEKEDQGNV